ncbi:MAG: hypothetical protein WKF94_03675 [Solirubrobacteraceae bacterium]
MNQTTLADPLEFVVDALGTLPEDPAKLDDVEFERISSIQQGLTRHTATILQAAADLALSLHHGEIDLDDAIGRRDEIGRAQMLGHEADAHLTEYITAALLARGHRLDDLLEAATHTTNGQEA